MTLHRRSTALFKPTAGVGVWIGSRQVRARFYGEPRTYEGYLIWRQEAGVYRTVGRSRGHATLDAALAAARKLAERRGFVVTSDNAQREIRRERYTDD